MNVIAKSIAGALALAAVVSAGASLGASPAPNGEQLFRQRCAMCHVVAPGAAATLGPNLSGVVGRKAGSTAFRTYSPALKASNLIWTRPNLDGFIAAPTRKVPGTRMAISITDPAQRAAIVQYLSTR